MRQRRDVFRLLDRERGRIQITVGFDLRQRGRQMPTRTSGFVEMSRTDCGNDPVPGMYSICQRSRLAARSCHCEPLRRRYSVAVRRCVSLIGALDVDGGQPAGMQPSGGRARRRHDTAGEDRQQIRGASATPVSASRIASGGALRMMRSSRGSSSVAEPPRAARMNTGPPNGATPVEPHGRWPLESGDDAPAQRAQSPARPERPISIVSVRTPVHADDSCAWTAAKSGKRRARDRTEA